MLFDGKHEGKYGQPLLLSIRLCLKIFPEISHFSLWPNFSCFEFLLYFIIDSLTTTICDKYLINHSDSNKIYMI